MVHAERLAEVFRQLAFISAVLGGFSVAFWVALLTTAPGRRIVPWAAGFAVAASVVLLFISLAMALSTVWIAQAGDSTYDRLPEPLSTIYAPVVPLLLLGVLLFLIALGLSGFARSRHLGIASSVMAGIGVAGVVWLMVLF